MQAEYWTKSVRIVMQKKAEQREGIPAGRKGTFDGRYGCRKCLRYFDKSNKRGVCLRYFRTTNVREGS